MSETTAVSTMTSSDDLRIGTVGAPVRGVEVKLADDGELLVRGPAVMRGYRKQPEKTAETIDADGWLSSGDIATIDDAGNVTIVDRKKELIINESGKNMSPTNIENTMKAASSLIGQVPSKEQSAGLTIAVGSSRAAMGRNVGLMWRAKNSLKVFHPPGGGGYWS